MTMKWRKAFAAWRITDVNSATDLELELAASACETLALISGILVVVGLVAEVIEATFHLQAYSFFDRWGAVLADLPVAVGVFGEIFFSAKTAARQSELQRRSKDRLSEATRQATEANERTAEIQKLTAWRHIAPEQLARIKDLIGDKAAALDLLIEYERGDPESYSYAREIVQIFQNVKRSKIRFGANQLLGVSSFGLYLEFAPKIDGDPIAAAFRSAGVVIADARERDLAGVIWGTDPPNFHIFVGPKPPPPLLVINNV
jgi:hypothetical protein